MTVVRLGIFGVAVESGKARCFAASDFVVRFKVRGNHFHLHANAKPNVSVCFRMLIILDVPKDFTVL